MDCSTYYLLLEDSCATQIGKIDQALLYVSAGSLWMINDQHGPVENLDQIHSSSNESPLYLKSCELINVYLSCSQKAVLSISEIEFELLLAVDSFAERKKLSIETNMLNIGRDIYDRYLDQFVSGQMCEIYVTIINYPGLTDNTCGLIHYVGSLPSRPGIWFGVKLPFAFMGFGSTDGSFKGKRFFECDEHCGLFLSIDKISVYQPHKDFDDVDFPEEDCSSKLDVVSVCEAPTCDSSALSLARLPLELGERIVWISDDGPELGTVRWIGILPDAKVKEYTIGVEFDRPIGTGTGKYNNEQLFRTAQNHASLIPAIGLMKAEEFFGSKDDVPEASFPKHVDVNTWHEFPVPGMEKSNFIEALHSSDQSDMGSSSETASQIFMYQQPSKTSNQHSTTSNRPLAESSNISPSVSMVSSPNNFAVDAPRQKSIQISAVLDHCYENVEKDETGRILNRDADSFQVAADSQQSDYLEYQPHAMPTPTSFHRSFDNIYAENRKSKFNSTNQNMEYDRVDSLKLSEVAVKHTFNNLKSRTLETYSTTRSIACKVFDENDVLLRLPYTTGRSIFYGRADDESLHANTGDLNKDPLQNKSASTTKPHRGFFKFISKRTPNIILQQINRTLRNSLLPQSFHRRSSSDSAPTIPERSSAVRGSLTLFSNSGCTVPCRQVEEIDSHPNETAPLPCEGQVICLKLRTDEAHKDENLVIQNLTEITESADPIAGTLPSKSARSAVTFQPRPSSPIQRERQRYPSSEVDVGSRVEVDVEGCTRHGVVRWMGCFKNRSNILVGIELESEHRACTDGKIGGRRFFSCPPGRAYFTFINSVRKDSRLFPLLNSSNPGLRKGVICPPLCFDDPDSLSRALNIKSMHRLPACNHADAVLFSMFTFSQAFDSVLLRHKSSDSDAVVEMRSTLLNHVVNPLRCGLSINTSRIECLERLVGERSTLKSKMAAEGPAHFYANLMQFLNADPQIIFSSGNGAQLWNVPVSEDGFINPTIQRLLELSFFQANHKLSQVPLCLVLNVQKRPRDLVIPCMELDITDVLQNSLRECNICGKLGTSECRECFEATQLLSSTVFCDACSDQFHGHVKRSHHKPLPVGSVVERSLRSDVAAGSGWADKMREKLELHAVICSKEFHSISFVRTGLTSTAPWMFFGASDLDEASGPGHPQVGICSFLPDLISHSSTNHLIALSKSEIPPLMDRLLFNADVYIYQFPALLLYK